MKSFRREDLRHRVRIERPLPDDSLAGAGSGTWELVAEAWAEVQDMLPSRGGAEQLVDGINVTTRHARVRMRWRNDITPAMRFVMGARIMPIVAGPAELGRREGVEFMVEDYTSPGNAA